MWFFSMFISHSQLIQGRQNFMDVHLPTKLWQKVIFSDIVAHHLPVNNYMYNGFMNLLISERYLNGFSRDNLLIYRILNIMKQFWIHLILEARSLSSVQYSSNRLELIHDSMTLSGEDLGFSFFQGQWSLTAAEPSHVLKLWFARTINSGYSRAKLSSDR